MKEGISEEYKQKILKYYDNNEDIEIPNPNEYHARFLIKLLLEKAKKQIRIFAGNLSNEIYSSEEIKNTIKKLKEKNINITIITENEPESNSFDSLKNLTQKRINIEKLPENTQKLIHMIPTHFITIDETSYRMEKIENRDIDSFKGAINFNKESLSKKLNLIFDNLLIPNSN